MITAQLQAAIAALETQRAVLGDRLAERALRPLRERLAAHEAAAPRLRRAQVTVLFADIVDSTALAARLDAEDVLQVFGRMLERAAACVQARGGRVLRYTGDGLKAGFGTQGTREDDAAQAVLAGLDILAAGREHAAWVASAYGVPGFALRVGAHTGEVALGAGFEADHTLTGDTVNIAARMEQAAPPGGLRISAATQAQVQGLFELQAAPPLVVKGLPGLQQTYLVERAQGGARRRSARGIQGVATRMVGRGAELGALQDALVQVQAGRRLAAVTVVGEAGVGKSRLLAEFEAWRAARPERTLLLHGATTPQTEGQIFGLLRDLLTRHHQIADDDGIELARAKLERGIVPLFVDDDGPDLAEGHAHLLGHLIGIEWRDSRHIRGILDDPRQLRDRALHAASQWLRRLAAREGCPLVLQLEDLHWADAESLGFLDRWAQAHRDVPLLLLATTRPALDERAVGWGAGDGAHRRLPLAPLDAGHSQALAAELLRRLPEVPPALGELLTRQAEGNPFYMEELVKVLIDRGTLQVGERWSVDPDRLQLDRVPTTLTGVLQARLDALPAAEKRALQQASIIGSLFWDRALAAVDAAAPAQLPALARRQLALPRGEAAADGLREFAFHHHLLQQVTYGTVLKQDRRDGHARVAQWMAGLDGLRAGDFLGAAAGHFELAGDRGQAVEFHARAAEHASQRFAHDRVLAHVGQAFALLGGGRAGPPALRWRLLGVRERSLSMLARRDEQGADLEAMHEAADTMGDDVRRAEVARRRAQRAMRIADWATMERSAREGMAFAARAGDDSERLQSLRLLVAATVSQGDAQAAAELAREGLADACRLGLRSVEGLLCNALALAVEKLGQTNAMLALNERALQVSRETANRASEAIGLGNLGWCLLGLGDLARARQATEAALPLTRANGDRVGEGVMLGHLSAIFLWEGDAAQALALARQTLDIERAAQATDMAVYGLLKLGAAALALDRHDEARLSFGEALSLAQSLGSGEVFDAAAGLAQVALAAGDPAAARSALQPVLDAVAAGGAVDRADYPREVEWTCHRVLQACGDPAAADWLARAHAALMAQHATLDDAALRRGLLQNVPHHRAIVAAWAAR